MHNLGSQENGHNNNNYSCIFEITEFQKPFFKFSIEIRHRKDLVYCNGHRVSFSIPLIKHEKGSGYF